MKKLILTAIVGLAANFATAQNIDFGIKGGAVFNTDKGKVWQDAGNIFKRDGKASAGFQAGALARVSLAGIYIQPELLYTQFKNADVPDVIQVRIEQRNILSIVLFFSIVRSSSNSAERVRI